MLQSCQHPIPLGKTDHQLTQEQIITMVDLMITRVEAALANKDMATELRLGSVS